MNPQLVLGCICFAAELQIMDLIINNVPKEIYLKGLRSLWTKDCVHIKIDKKIEEMNSE